MNSKLTLSIDESTIEKAKFYAKSQKRSLSDLIENYLKSITNEDNNEQIELSPKTKYLKGSFKDSGFDYKEELTEQLSKKFLK